MTATKNVLKLVEENLDYLVELAEKCIEQTNAAGRRDLEESQLRNLQNLAAATDSLAVIKNYIGYQMGREELFPQFAQRLLTDLDQIKNKAETLCREHQITDPGQVAKARGEMTRYYFGFLTRKFVTVKKGGRQG
ncbi:MAG: hypothetical protein RMJ19_04690 [Gemmatales bacterium]|nr:hypothetical protein [Gemmatales bacterium]MCS7159749.1 hypothetical protein [Gemmatales bacterium]MDW8174947.1 hypothetical protein [Gemmatales bacterium]MDW8221333.1 hypothetical protein [Gemmatales bacterium]